MKKVTIITDFDLNLPFGGGKVNFKKGQEFELLGEIDYKDTKMVILHDVETVPVGILKDLEGFYFEINA